MSRTEELNFEQIPCFGVAGNFTGHLEQAGEAVDFAKTVVKEANAPKAIFPTYLPMGNISQLTPEFLHVYPVDCKKIIYPEGEQKVQLEPECGIYFDAIWKDSKLVDLIPICFGASNDCSIRKEGAKKISIKKNWGKSSKGVSSKLIELNSFSKEKSILNNYNIVSFLQRGNEIYQYGEDSPVSEYSYVFEKLTYWMIDKFNNQKDEGPAENLNEYLKESGCPEKIFVSIGATRYTEYGQTNFLQPDDFSCVVVYPRDKYCQDNLKKMILEQNYCAPDISFLVQRVLMGE